MKKATITFVSAALAGAVLLSGAARAQGPSQTVDIAKIDVQQLSAGYRASKVIGSSVLNDANETIGKVDDLLISPDGKTPFAVLSIGGFLGMNSHYVVVPYDSLKLVDNKVVLPGGTKDMLKMLPEFKYAAK
jgi:sporulation protein YlmC with PRC-barrel domain